MLLKTSPTLLQEISNSTVFRANCRPFSLTYSLNPCTRDTHHSVQPCFHLEVPSFLIYRHVLVIGLAFTSRRRVGGSMTCPRGLQVDAVPGLNSANEDASSVANNFFMYIFKVRAWVGRPCLSVPQSLLACVYMRVTLASVRPGSASMGFNRQGSDTLSIQQACSVQ